MQVEAERLNEEATEIMEARQDSGFNQKGRRLVRNGGIFICFKGSGSGIC